MAVKDLIELLTTPKALAKGTLILEYAKNIKESAALMNNAIESDKILVAGREAGRIQDAAEIIVELLRD